MGDGLKSGNERVCRSHLRHRAACHRPACLLQSIGAVMSPINRIAARARAVALSFLFIAPAAAVAQVPAFPAAFHARRIATNGTTLYVRSGGTGPAVVLLHGF